MILPLIIQRRLNRSKPPLKLYWWRYRYPEKLNFGDELTPIIIARLWGRTCVWSDIKECELAGTGSIIEQIEHHAGDHPIKIWGSGFIKEGQVNTMPNLDFYAIRGPLSLERITSKRVVALGDPGLLANKVFKPSSHVTYEIGIVAHYIDVDHPAIEKIKRNPRCKLIDPLLSPEQVIQEITACRFILSSSLHGLIMADSFGIPNYWMPLSDKVAGGNYKFKDYYASTKRELRSVQPEVLEDEEVVKGLIRQYRKVPNLKKLQRGLIKSFPYQVNF